MSAVATAPATFYTVVGGNDVTWRCEWPAAAVGAQVVKIPEGSSVSDPNTESAFPWTMLLDMEDGTRQIIDSKERYETLCADGARYVNASTVFPQHEGVAVFSRPNLELATLGLSMQKQGIRIVAEADDNFFCPADQNLFLRQAGANDLIRESHARAMGAFGTNVFSTKWLRDRYFREYRRRFGHRTTKQHMDLRVARNHMALENWPAIVEHDGPVRVGFMGSPSHIWDVQLIYTAFHVAKQMGCETWMVGYNPGNIDPDPSYPESMELEDGTVVHARSKKSRDVEAKWATVVDNHIRWIAPEEFHRIALPFDIALAPLQNTEFNCGRSDIKAIEGTVAGAAVGCAKMPPFTRAGWRHGVNCLMAQTELEYAGAVKVLVEHPELRARLVEAAQEMVRSERNGDVLRAEWQNALTL